MKFSTVYTGARAKMVKVREVTRVSTEVRVVGLQYARSLVWSSKHAKVGDTLRLQLEPDNADDKNAVKVFNDDTHVGYIERAQAAAVGEAIKGLGSEAVTATISRIDDRADIYNRLWVVIEATYYVKA